MDCFKHQHCENGLQSVDDSYLDPLAGFKRPTSKDRQGGKEKGRGEGGEGRGKRKRKEGWERGRKGERSPCSDFTI